MACNIQPFYFKGPWRSIMENMFSSFSFIMYLLATLRTEMLLTALTKYSFWGLGYLLTLLTYKLNFIFMGRMRIEAIGTAYLLTILTPKRAPRLFVTFLTSYGHFWILFRLFLIYRVYIIRMYKNFMNVNYQIIQEIKADFLNLAHCWLYSILYYY